MATATALTNRRDQAIQLRAEAQTLGQDVARLREKLDIAQRALGVLQDKRQKFTEDAAAGRDPKPGAIAALAVAIDEATIPCEGLTSAVNRKQAAFDTVRANLETLEYELRIEAQQEARQARFQALETQGTEAATRIAEKLRALIQDDLPAFDQVRESLVNEFIGMFNGDMANPEANKARALIHQLEAQFSDVERKLLKSGRTVAGNVELTIRSLRPPR